MTMLSDWTIYRWRFLMSWEIFMVKIKSDTTSHLLSESVQSDNEHLHELAYYSQ